MAVGECESSPLHIIKNFRNTLHKNAAAALEPQVLVAWLHMSMQDGLYYLHKVPTCSGFRGMRCLRLSCRCAFDLIDSSRLKLSAVVPFSPVVAHF